MGFFADKLLGELRGEFIARPDTSKDQIVYKWPNTTIRKLSQLTVEADETAVFFRDGKVAGTFPPGRYTLDSTQIPFLGILVDAATGDPATPEAEPQPVRQNNRVRSLVVTALGTLTRAR